MKTKLLILFLLSATLILVGCHQKKDDYHNDISSELHELSKIPEKLLIKSEKIIEDTKEYVISVTLPQINIPGLKKMEDQVNEDMTEFAENTIALFKEKAKEVEVTAQKIKIDLDYQVTTDEHDFLSVSIMTHDFLNDRERHTRTSFNYYFGSLTRLTLKDLLGEDYIEILNVEIKRQMTENGISQEMMVREFDSVNQHTLFYLEEGQLVIYFKEEELYKYEYGIFEFIIPVSVYTPYTLSE